MTSPIKSIAGKKHRQLARQVGVLSRSSLQVRWPRSTSAQSLLSPVWSSPSGVSTSSLASTEGFTFPTRRRLGLDRSDQTRPAVLRFQVGLSPTGKWIYSAQVPVRIL